MKETLLFIGAGSAQTGGIEMARKMGFHVIALDGNPEAPGLKIANNSIVIDIFAYDQIIALAKKEPVTAVISIASEVCLETVARVNQALGLKGLSLEQTKLVTDKGRMRNAYLKHRVPGPKFHILSTEENISNIAEKIGFPMIVKPVDASGSKGVCLVAKPQELTDKIQLALKQSSSHQVILEEFMPGVELALDGFVINGQLHVLSLSDKTRTPPPYLLDTSVTFPSSQPKAIQEEAESVAAQAVKALGLNHCPIHMEMIITPTGVKVVELAARGAGFKVYTHIIPYVSGIDPVKLQLQLLKGETPSIKPRRHIKGACIRFLGGTQGIVESIIGVEKAANIKQVYELDIYVKPGDITRDLSCGADRIGHIITFADSRQEAINAADKAINQIRIQIQTMTQNDKTIFDRSKNVWEKNLIKFPETLLQYPDENLIRLLSGKYVDVPAAPAKIMDHGFGHGNNLGFFASKGYACYGCEISELLVNEVNELFAKIKYPVDLRLIENLSIPFADNSFDIVVSWNVIHYNGTREAVQTVIDDLYRILKPSGTLLLSTLNQGSCLFDRITPQGNGSYFIKDASHYDNRQGLTLFAADDQEDLMAMFSAFSIVKTGQCSFDLFKPEKRHSSNLIYAKK